MTVALLPDAEALFVSWAKSHPDLSVLHGGRVGTVLNATLPALRVTRVGVAPDERWEDVAELQVDCYAADQGAANLLARTVTAALPDLQGDRPGFGWVGSADVTVGPVWLPDNDTGRARYMLAVTLTTYPG